MGKGRECSESCLDYLLAELANVYGTIPGISDADGDVADGAAASTSGAAAPSRPGMPGPAALEAIGFRVGRQLAERYTKDRGARMAEPLEVIKFMCKEFWSLVFKKQVDNLRTNHRGTFVLKDNCFRWTAALSTAPNAATPACEVARAYLVLPCALIRGALTQLGLECVVSADPSNLPVCDFTVIVKPAAGGQAR